MITPKALSISAWPAHGRSLFPGVLAWAVVAVAAPFSQRYGAPVMLFALLLGMAMNFLRRHSSGLGIEFTARQVCGSVSRCSDRASLPDRLPNSASGPVGLVLLSVALTIVVSMIAARHARLPDPVRSAQRRRSRDLRRVGFALALAAACCGASPEGARTLFTVVGVSALSTLAMIGYPMLTQWIGLDARSAGSFLGATIHDVAQVVGAGYAMSRETGDVATFVKLLRVADAAAGDPCSRSCSPGSASAAVAGGDGIAARALPLLPWFAVAFAILVAVNSLQMLPASVPAFGNEASRWCLVAAIAGIGMKTQLRNSRASASSRSH